MMSAMVHDLVIVGAGMSGLTLARARATAELRPVVIERARGVGGRCVPQRVADQP